jgi:hypothetical protein
MPLVMRGDRPYWYKSYRKEGRTVTEYVCAGPEAIRAAGRAEEQRAARAAEQATRKAVHAAVRRAARALARDPYERRMRLVNAARDGQYRAIKRLLDERDRLYFARLRKRQRRARRERRRERRWRAEQWSTVARVRESLQAEDETMADVAALGSLLMAIAGFHQHKRTWRMKRTPKMDTKVVESSREGDRDATAAFPRTIPPEGSPEREAYVARVQELLRGLRQLDTEAIRARFDWALVSAPEALFELLNVDVVRWVEAKLIGRAHPDGEPGPCRAAKALLDRVRADFAGPDATPLARPLAAVAALCWYDWHLVMNRLQYVRHVYDHPEGLPPRPGEPDFLNHMLVAMEKRADRCHERFLSACRTLAYVQARPPAGPVRVRAAAKAGDTKCVVAVEMQSATSEASRVSTPETPRRP